MGSIDSMKIALVVQRYGLEVNGGAELHCRQVAEHLARYHDVEVITTCAIDYLSWKNDYPEGPQVVNGLAVHRFPVDRERDVARFNRFSEKVLNCTHSYKDELEWMELQGPYAPRLVSYIKDHKDSYDIFIFFTYLYYSTFFGLPEVGKKAILVPTAHDEPPIYLEMFGKFFNSPGAIAYNTREEKAFVNALTGNTEIPDAIVGVGIDVPQAADPARFRKKYALTDDFILYVGRIDPSKGCEELFEFLLRYNREFSKSLKLVTMGKPAMKMPTDNHIVSLGFVSDQDKFDGIAASRLLIVPSPYESLSMVLLEAWVLKKATLVNGRCEVLKAQSIRSNAGLWYIDYNEFKECLNFLLENDVLISKLGENGRSYVLANYTWEIIEKKYFDMLASLYSRSSHLSRTSIK